VGGSGDRVAVVGGGISGLLSATLLARQGHEVTIIDREPALGGLLGSIRHGGHWFDHGTHIPQETGHPALDELLFSDLDPGQWHSIDVVRAGHVFHAALDPVSPFPSLATLGPSTHDRAVVELLECSDPGAGHRSSADELRATFGPTITEQVFRVPVERVFGRTLEQLGPGAHRLLFQRVKALDGPTTATLKAAVPHLDATLAFHRPADGPNRPAWYPREGGSGRWVDTLVERHLSAVDLRLRSGVEKVVVDGTVSSLLLGDGAELAVDRLVWTLAPAHFLALAGIDPPVGPARPEFVPVSLHHLVLDRALTTEAHCVAVHDPGFETNRVTLYPNLRGGGPPTCTVGRYGTRSSTTATALVDELVALGIASPGTRAHEAGTDQIPVAFPIPTPAGAAAAEAMTVAAEQAAANATFLGRSTGRAFFMPEVFTECYDALT
jgi:phytoene dehydrogenase-like protein